MQRLAAYSVRTCLAGLLVALLASGCASTKLEPARMFAAETAKLSAVLPPMLAGTHDSCMANSMRKQILLSKAFDAAANEQAAAATCAPILPTSAQVAAINAINEIVLAYANSIAAAANGDLKSFSAESNSLGEALGSLQRPGSGTPVFDEGKLGRVAFCRPGAVTVAQSRRSGEGGIGVGAVDHHAGIGAGGHV